MKKNKGKKINKGEERESERETWCDLEGEPGERGGKQFGKGRNEKEYICTCIGDEISYKNQIMVKKISNYSAEIKS